MLPSSGLFKDIVCPCYKDSTSCQRPFCHFRHVRNDTIIEQLNDPVIKEAFLSKNYTNILQYTESKNECFLQIPTYNAIAQNHIYKPTPISKLLTDNNGSSGNNMKAKPYSPSVIIKNEAPIYIPSSISDNTTMNGIDIKKDVETKLTSVHYIPPLSNGSTTKEKISYKPSSTSSLHKNKNTYEPLGASENTINDSIIKHVVLDYKPSPSKSLHQNINTYEPHNTSSTVIINSKKNEDDALTYKPSVSSAVHKHSMYEPHGTISNIVEYEPSKTHNNKRNSPSILNEINNLSNDKLPTNSHVKKPKLDINLDDFENEFDLIDEILCASNDSQDAMTKNYKEKDTSAINKITNSTKDSKSSSSKNTSSSSKHKSKHKSSTHKSSSSPHTSESKSESSSKDKKLHSKSVPIDKKRTHQSKTKHDSKSKSLVKESISHDKSKDIKKPNSSSSHNRKHHKTKGHMPENIEKLAQKVNLTTRHKDEFLFSDEDTELDRPVCTTDLRDPIVLECLKISQEYNNRLENLKQPIVDKQTKASINVTEVEQIEIKPIKKRIAHSAAVPIIRTPAKPTKKFAPATTFMERYKKIVATQRLEEIQECEKRLEEIVNPDSNASAQSNRRTGSSDISKLKSTYASVVNSRPTLSKPIPARVAHIPKNVPVSSTTAPAQTLKKGTVRKAHVPSPNLLKKMDPNNLLDLNNCRIPANVRLSYLNYITEACLEMHKNNVENAYKMARDEELLVAKKCRNIKVYKNSCLASILKIRKATKESQNGMNGFTRNTVNSKDENMSTSQKYSLLKKWILNEKDLENNSYPLPTEFKGLVKVVNDYKKLIDDSKTIRQCARCPTQYTVDNEGMPLIRDACIYHPKRCYTFRGRSTYGCCGTERGSVGCSSGDHVIDGIIGPGENLRTGFVQTLQKPSGHIANESIYALDCEMVYTTKGVELARVTVVNDSLESVYDTFVKPENYILDYATVFSGITEDMLKDVTTTIFHVQAVLLNLFSETTILVGHSLESDLKALKIVHKCIIDTSILFPHKAGPPFKRALKSLASEYLQKIIQESHCGHDSAEDARISMELVLWKLRDSLKL